MMFSSLIPNIFPKKKTSLKVPDSILIKKVQECANLHSLYIFKDVKIFNHTEILDIPLLIVDPKRGIFIFEYKTWCYNEIKNLKASKSSHEDSSKNSLAFESKHDFIKKRFNEVLNNDGPDIFNFVLMENLLEEEFERLDTSFQELIPTSKTLFSSDSVEDIKEKFSNASEENPDILNIASIVSTLFAQNTVIDKDGSVKMTCEEQNAIINHKFSGTNYIATQYCSGKTTTILLKAIYVYLLNREKNIAIVKPTNIACELLKQKLLYTVEHSIVEVDFSHIAIVTPYNLDRKKMDMILIDDASMQDKGFIESLHGLKKDILFFEDYDESKTYEFSLKHNYREDSTIELLNGNPYALMFINIQRLLSKNVDSNEILIITTDDDDKYKILEDLESFVQEPPTLLDPFESINNQHLNNILIANFDEIFGFSKDYVFVFNPKDIEVNVVNYIFSRANKKTFVIYDEDNEAIGNIDAKDIQNR